MNTLLLPKSFVKLLEEFSPIFFARIFPYFKVVIKGLLLANGKRTVTAALRLSRLKSYWGNVHRFASDYKWDISLLAFKLLNLIISLMNIKGLLTFVIDDTLVKKIGQKIFGCGIHFDHSAKKNEPCYIHGHNWVILALVHRCQLFKKVLTFPFWAKLFIPKNRIGPDETFHSRIDLAVEMLKTLQTALKRRFCVVVDALYAKRKLIRYCIEISIPLISRIRKDAALYASLKQPRRRKRGRPRKYGQRLPSLTAQAKNKRGFIDYKLILYHKEVKVSVKTIKALWKPAGAVINILIVFYPKKSKPSFFFCTDLSFSVPEILQRVADRWGIENAIRDMKQHLGLTDHQCRKPLAVQRSANFNCFSLSILTLWSYLEASQLQPELWDSVPWYPQKRRISVQDMLYQLRNKCVPENIFRKLAQSGINPKKIDSLKDDLELAA